MENEMNKKKPLTLNQAREAAIIAKQVSASKRKLRKLSACEWLDRLAILDKYTAARVAKILWWDYLAVDDSRRKVPCGYHMFIRLYRIGGCVSHFTEPPELEAALIQIGYHPVVAARRAKPAHIHKTGCRVAC